MEMRLLFAIPDSESLTLLRTILDSALGLTPLDVQATSIGDEAGLMKRANANSDDIIILDWAIAGSETPTLVRTLLDVNPKLRIVALLPEHYRQYRQRVWDAGACNGIPKEHVDQEWLSTVLCIMHRAMQREARILAQIAQGQ